MKEEVDKFILGLLKSFFYPLLVLLGLALGVVCFKEILFQVDITSKEIVEKVLQ